MVAFPAPLAPAESGDVASGDAAGEFEEAALPPKVALNAAPEEFVPLNSVNIC